MRKLVFIILSLNSFLSNAQGTEEYNIYVGKIDGITIDSFLKERMSYDEFRYDSSLDLQDITISEFPIEIRIYARWSLRGFIVCSRLYYDDKKYKFSQTLNTTLRYSMVREKDNFELKTNLKHDNVDSVFNELIKNGIFSLPAETFDDVPLDSSRMVLTSQGLKVAQRQWGSTDGISYTLIWKVGNKYNSISFSTGDLNELMNYPDIDHLKRQENIVNFLIPDVELIQKK